MSRRSLNPGLDDEPLSFMTLPEGGRKTGTQAFRRGVHPEALSYSPRMFADELRAAFPSYGPGWDAAIAYGIDVSLLLENLALTPTERLEQLQAMIEFYEKVRPKDVVDAAE